ncbi:MAG TPA: GGDEF domain-containing protein [Solirubrobacteraceae bacterium]|nr:GGDEF domain-containing protein [Solirubrobacteraceae bacterium]
MEKQALTGTNFGRVRDLAVKGWAVGIVIACALMIPAPPTAQLGAWGWAAGGGIQALSAIALVTFRRYQARVTARHLLAVTWALPIDVGLMQWLAGGWDAPYHELHLLALILGSAALSPRRFAWFAAAVSAIALSPALYAPDADALLATVVSLTVWLFVTTALALLMARVRGQARLARVDQLTHLANRRALDELFALPRTGTLVLAIGDLDGFKQINDRHGHLAGDACLAAVARVLSESSRAGDQVFRWGGDEFAVLLPDASEAVARGVLERLEAAVADAVRDPSGAPVTITFGHAAGGPDAELRALTSAADAALLARKAARPAAHT